MANIRPKASREGKNCVSPFLYRNQNVIDRMFCRLERFRAKWIPVRVKKTRQNKKPGSDSIRTD
jgi:hypothetical protein